METPWVEYYYEPHFTDRKTEAQWKKENKEAKYSYMQYKNE